MAIKINQYPLERLTFGDDDYYDIDYWNGSTYETAKIKGSTIKAGIQAGILNLYENSSALTSNREVAGAGFNLSLGANLSGNNLNRFNINSVYATEQYSGSGFPFVGTGLGTIIEKSNLGVVTVVRKNLTESATLTHNNQVIRLQVVDGSLSNTSSVSPGPIPS